MFCIVRVVLVHVLYCDNGKHTLVCLYFDSGTRGEGGEALKNTGLEHIFFQKKIFSRWQLNAFVLKVRGDRMMMNCIRLQNE
jgi:hypothetical protein